VSIARNRLDELDNFLPTFQTMHPRFRIEVRCKLPPNSTISPDDLDDWPTALSFVWDAILAVWGRLSLINIPTSYLVMCARICSTYARSTSAVPSHSRAFCGDNNATMDDTKKILAALIFNSYGVSSRMSNLSFTVNFQNVLDKKTSPYEWLAVEILSHHAAGSRQKLDEILRSPPKSPMQRPHSLPVSSHHGLPQPFSEGNTVIPMKSSPVDIQLPFCTLAPSIEELYSIVLDVDQDKNPFHCKLAPLLLEDLVNSSDFDLTGENRLLLERISGDADLKALFDNLDIHTSRTQQNMRTFIVKRKFQAKHGTQIRNFLTDENPLKLIILTRDLIVKKKLTTSWRQCLVLRRKNSHQSPRQRRTPRQKRTRSNNKSPRQSRTSRLRRTRSNNNATAMDESDEEFNVSALVEIAASAARRTRRARRTRSMQGNTTSAAEDFVGKLVMKYFGGQVYAGVVSRYDPEEGDSKAQWHINYDDGDEEDMYEDELNDSMQLYRRLTTGSENVS